MMLSACSARVESASPLLDSADIVVAADAAVVVVDVVAAGVGDSFADDCCEEGENDILNSKINSYCFRLGLFNIFFQVWNK